MSAVTLDSAAFTAPAGLDLGTVSGGHPEKIVKFRIGLFSYKNRRKDVFEAADDISSVSLITESVVRFGVFIDLPIRRGFREGGKVGVKQIDKELLLNRNGSGTVKLFQEELVIEFVILQFQAPAFEVKLLTANHRQQALSDAKQALAGCPARWRIIKASALFRSERA